jgi:transposase InsO family protein
LRRARSQQWQALGVDEQFDAAGDARSARFIQTSLREWAYARAYLNSTQRAHDLPFFIHRYNWHRPHAAIGGKPPISRIALSEEYLLRLHS